MFSTTPPALRPGRMLCSFMINGDMPCARRVDYFIVTNVPSPGNRGNRARACYTHMMGLIWNYQWAKLDLPAFYARIDN